MYHFWCDNSNETFNDFQILGNLCAYFLQVNFIFQDSTFDIEAHKHEFEAAMLENAGDNVSSFQDMDDIDFDTELNAIEIDGIQGIAAIVLEKIGHLRQSV